MRAIIAQDASLKIQQILSGSHDFDRFTGSTEQSFRDGEALYYGLLDSTEGLINAVRILPDLASIYRNSRVHKLPPGLGVPQLPLSASSLCHTYSEFVFRVVPNLVSQSQIFPSWVPGFLISFSPSKFPMKPLCPL